MEPINNPNADPTTCSSWYRQWVAYWTTHWQTNSRLVKSWTGPLAGWSTRWQWVFVNHGKTALYFFTLNLNLDLTLSNFFGYAHG